MFIRKTKIILAIIAAILILPASIGAIISVLPKAYASGGDIFQIAPTSGSYQNDSNFTVTITETSTDPINSLQANVNFNSSDLQFVGVSAGSAAGSPFTNVNQSGLSGSTVQIGASVQPGTLTGKYNVATITFKVLASGGKSSVLTFNPSSGMFDPVSSQPVWSGSTTGATLTLTSAPAPTPSPSPSPTPAPAGVGSGPTGSGGASGSGSSSSSSKSSTKSSNNSVATPNNTLSTSPNVNPIASDGSASQSSPTSTGHEITIRVVNASNHPVADATVVLNNQTEKTNKQGIAAFNALAGEYKVSVSGKGIKSYTKTLVISPGQSTQYTLTAQNSGLSVVIIALSLLLFFAFDSLAVGLYMRAQHRKSLLVSGVGNVQAMTPIVSSAQNITASPPIATQPTIIQPIDTTTIKVAPIIEPAQDSTSVVPATQSAGPLTTPVQIITPSNAAPSVEPSQPEVISSPETNIQNNPSQTPSKEVEDNEVRFG